MISYLSFVYLLQMSSVLNHQCKDSLSQAYVDKTEIIAIVTISEDQPSEQVWIADVKKVFKGELREQIAINVNSDLTFGTGCEYLIFASSVNHRYSIDQCSRTSVLQEAETDLVFINNTIKCVHDKLKHDRPCQRNLDPVCGCNNITYGNLCEARREGIAIYSPGRCKD
jgi:hypothetical protein